MPFFGNPYGQDAAQFGQQAGQALSQGLLQLPQQRYEIALRQAMMQRQAQQQQNLQQYHQGVLGLRQQGLTNQNANAEMLNQIRLLQTQMQGQHYGAMENRPINMGGGNVLIPGQGGMGQGEATQQGLTSNPPNPQQQQQGQGFNGFQLMQAPRQPTPMTANQGLGNQLKALQLYGMGSSVTNDPAVRNFLMNTSSNIVQGLRQPQQGQQMQMQMQGGQGLTPQQPSGQGVDTNAIMQQAMQAIQQGANPQAVHQRLQQQFGMGLPSMTNQNAGLQ